MRRSGPAARTTDKMQRLSAQWRAQQQEAARLHAAIEANLRELGYE